MNLLENYNTASQKYGIELVKQLTELGLPPQYLLSACRFVKENSIPLSNMINQFKEWAKFVTKYNKYDVNRLSYDDFLRIISQEKSKHIIPNLIWQNEIAFLGKLNNAKDVQTIPIKNQWCIKSQNWFDRYTDKGYVFFVIYLPNEPLPFTFVVVAVCGGNVEYYDTQDYEQFEDLRGGNENNSDHEIYQRKLPNEIVSYLYDIAASQTEAMENRIKTENNEYKTNKNMKKQVIRLTEGDLHRVIKESVEKIVKEGKYDGDFPYDYYYDEDGYVMDETISEQLYDAQSALSGVLGLINALSNRYNNPRISKTARKISDNILKIKSYLDPRSSFVRACILQAPNTWAYVDNNKKPQYVDRRSMLGRQAHYDITQRVGARKIYPKQQQDPL